MVIYGIAIIGILLLINTILIIILHRGLIQELNRGLANLDSGIAQAIQSIIEENIGSVTSEVPPAQAMIMEFLKSHMSKQPNMDLLRNDEGKFKKGSDL